MTTKRDKIKYFEAGPIPVYFGVCLSQEAFDREMRRMGVDDAGSFVGVGADATCHGLQRKNAMDCIIICICAKKARRRDKTEVAGLIAHEATHATDLALKAMREDEPGREVRACLTQWFVQCVQSAMR